MNPFSLIKKRGIVPALYKIKRRIFPDNKQIIGEMALFGAYDYLQKYKYVLDIKHNIQASSNPYPNKIWTMWLQGVENAPEIVQKCVKSIVAQHGEDVIVLDNSNVARYIEIPDYIMQKWQTGIISNTHFSDIIRVLLLAKHGGVWIDATAFLFDKIPSYILNAKFFCFKVIPNANVVASNWFLAVQASSPIMLKMKNLLLEYWKKENRLVSYSIFHLFFSMAVETEKEMWQRVPRFDDINCKILQMELFDDFSSERLEQIKQMSVIQKLSYKFPKENFEKKGTFYKMIVK